MEKKTSGSPVLLLRKRTQVLKTLHRLGTSIPAFRDAYAELMVEEEKKRNAKSASQTKARSRQSRKGV